jgi:cardiolipin synthase
MGYTPATKLGVLFLLGSLCGGAQSSLAATTEKFYENASGSPLITVIQTATKTIDIEIYEMNDPQVQAALKAAVNKGVRVRIIQEEKPVGASCKVFNPASTADNDSCKAQKNLAAFIRSKGGTYVPFAYKQLCGISGTHCFQHGKMVLADSRYALLSTGNFNSSSLCNRAENPSACNRDYTMVTTDATAVRTLETIFEKDLKGTRYDVTEVLASSGTDKVTVSPDSMSPLVAFIRSAKKTVQIQNQYLKDPTLNAAIVDAAKRGVQVFVMVSSACSYGKPSANDIAQWTQIYGAFDKAKVNTRIFTRNITVNGVKGYLHAKTILVDSARAWVGSVNGSTTSLSNNREYGMFFNDPAEVKKLATFLYSDYTSKESESWKDSLVCKNDYVSNSTPDDGGDDVR